MVTSFVLSLLAALPDALMAVWLKLLGDGLLNIGPGWRAPPRLDSASRRPRRGSCGRSAPGSNGASAIA